MKKQRRKTLFLSSTELRACMEGLSSALKRSDLPIIVEMDSILAVKLIQSRDLDKSIYAWIVKVIKYVLGIRGSCITHVNRSQNKVSDCLARFAKLEGQTMTWVGSGLDVAVELAVAQCMDTMS